MTVSAIKEAAADATWDEPRSVDEARDRMSDLLINVKQIDGQLSLHREEGALPPTVEVSPAKWRGSALAAKEFLLAEYRFLKHWLHQHPSRTPVDKVDEPSLGMLRIVLGRMKRLAAVLAAAETFIADDNDENFDALANAVDEARRLGAGLIEEDDLA